MIRLERLTAGKERLAAAALMADCGLRLSEGLDALYGAYEGGALLGCGGFQGATIRCVAVRPEARGGGLMSVLVSHLVTELKARGHRRIFVFTRPESAPRFEELGFFRLTMAREACLLENRPDGVDRWLKTLPAPDADCCGAVVINGNPFTKGHRYIVEQAAHVCDRLYVFVLSEEASRFSAAERLSMARDGCADISGVTVVGGGPYCLSQACFPDYFLKRVSDAGRVFAELDAALFAERIAPVLRIRARFVGSEPLDPLTAMYNEALHSVLPAHGVKLYEIERLRQDDAPVSASRLRTYLDKPDFAAAAALSPRSTRPYLIGRLALEALIAEAEATPKPGLVDQDGSGAHKDMDLALLCRSAAVLGQYFTRFAAMGQREENGAPPDITRLRPLGLEAERAMLETTGGVNTHRGAIFTLGVFSYLAGRFPDHDAAALCADAALLCRGLCQELPRAQGHGAQAYRTYGARGPRGEAEDGYPAVRTLALPVFEAALARGLPENDALTWTLLHLISGTEDTNLLHRGGADGAAYARAAAQALIARHDPLNASYIPALRALDRDFSCRNLSPGGSADLLAAARFLHTLCACA